MDGQDLKKMRILFVAPYKAGIGGLTLWAKNVLGHYSALKANDLTIDAISPEGTPVKYARSPLRRTYIGITKYLKVIGSEWRMMRAGQYDVMHLCSSASISLLKDIVMLDLAKRHHVHGVVHFHFGRIPALKEKNNWEWKLLCRVVRKSSVAVTIDRMSYEALTSQGFHNVEYLPNPVSNEVSGYVHAHGHEIQRDERMVFYAGHCIKTKGIYELVSACKGIENVRLLLAGRIYDETKRELEELANHEPWLEIVGQQPHEEILRLMMQCGVYVLPSYTEGFPNVILESMACGCAIVATTVGAIPEMIGDEDGGHYGMLVPPEDTENLRQAIARLLADEGLREECRRNARERVNKRYNMETVWGELTRIWHHAVRNK